MFRAGVFKPLLGSCALAVENSGPACVDSIYVAWCLGREWQEAHLLAPMGLFSLFPNQTSSGSPVNWGLQLSWAVTSLFFITCYISQNSGIPERSFPDSEYRDWGLSPIWRKGRGQCIKGSVFISPFSWWDCWHFHWHLQLVKPHGTNKMPPVLGHLYVSWPFVVDVSGVCQLQNALVLSDPVPAVVLHMVTVRLLILGEVL